MCRCVLCLILGHSGAVVVLKFYGFLKFFFFFLDRWLVIVMIVVLVGGVGIF